MKRFFKVSGGRNRPTVIVETGGFSKTGHDRRKVSPGMQRIAKELTDEFGVPVEQVGDPDFYLVDRLTGRPLVRRRKTAEQHS